jgi:acetolactate synthase-1/2/3 large subunit
MERSEIRVNPGPGLRFRSIQATKATEDRAMDEQHPTRIAAEDYLETLAAHGIDYLFVNPGTDFAPIVEAFARAARSNRKVPAPMVVPHENAAVGMAHGVTMISGRPQAVMVHTNVGTANGINMLIDAARDRIPMLFTSGRTPLTEKGPAGTRSAYIHWAQEMFDQAGMLREIVKWDYELRRGDQVADAVDRALTLATASPSGPVYLSLPREVLGEPAVGMEARAPRARPQAPHPSPADIERLAGWIAEARAPLIITSSAGRFPQDSVALARLAERYALPVVGSSPRHFVLPSSHPMYMGTTVSGLLPDADLVIALEADVPWIPSKESPRPGARVVQIGEDPLYERYPMRNFPSDLTIKSATGPLLAALEAALAVRRPNVDARRRHTEKTSAMLRARWQSEIDAAGQKEKITLPWLNHCLRAVLEPDAIVVNEYSFRQEWCPLEAPGSLFGVASAGGLGWGFPAALGAKLAAPDRMVAAFLGDGAYMFANPTACHWMAEEHKLPVLTVIYNNALYGAVRRATLDMYPKSTAAGEDGRRLAELSHGPAFEQVVAAHGGHGERVERPADLPAALQRAAASVHAGKQALVNAICSL